MRLHERTFIVQGAEAEIGQAILRIEQERKLTPAEVAHILAGVAARYTNLLLRFERHGTYDKKADEA